MLAIASTDPEIVETLSRYGVELSRYDQGRVLLAEASTRETAQRTLLGAQVASTKILEKNFQRFSKRFGADRRLVQSVVPIEEPLFQELRLHLKTELGRAGLLRQAIHFYQEVAGNETVLQYLNTTYNLPPDTFDSRREHLTEVLTFRQNQQLLIGRTRVATQVRKEAMKQLDTWMGEFISILRVAFKSNPEQLVKLGMAVSPPRRGVQNEEEPDASEV